MDARELKALQIAATMPIKRTQHAWVVPSQTGHGSYKVAHPTLGHLDGALHGLTCTCPDFEERRMPCKHIIAVEYTVKRETPEGDVVTETVKVTYSQTWAAYNAAQCEEKERFMPMLADLCGTLSRPYSGKGRPPLPLSDMAFACVSRVYAGLSARRFDTDVRQSKEQGLTDSDPHFNSVLRYLRDPAMTPVLQRLVTLSAMPLKAVETDFAVDSTGFTTCRFVRWYDHKWGKERTKREWVKLHAMTGVRTNVVTSVEMTDYRGADTLQFRPLVAATAENFTIREVSGDKAYSSKRNLQAVADLGATPFVPFRANSNTGEAYPAIHADVLLPEMASAWTKMLAYFVYQRETFLTHYHKRSNVETTFSMIKRKFGDSLRSKSPTGQANEVLCKVIAHNLCCLIAAIHELGMDAPTFSLAG
ncbi:MAG TPA: transposase [Acidimicrobiales bacterium]|nr:transposase [Acidimicrobiales bacterium]